MRRLEKCFVQGSVACILVFLSGCIASEYSAGYCAESNLEQLASSHASQGLEQKTEELISNCSVQGVDLEKSVYLTSYENSRENFCRTTDAFQYGIKGNPYEGICTEPTSFEQDYRLGKTIFDLRYEIWKIENSLDRSEREMDIYLSGTTYAGGSREDDIRKDIREYKAEIGHLRILLYENLDEARALGFNLE